MSDATPDHSILGGWLGTYYYRSRHEMPVRFEATFSPLRDDATGFGGTILDDLPSGEAVVTHGQQTGPSVRFTKTYREPTAGSEGAPIHYLGTMSDDGKLVTGSWETHFRRQGKLRRLKGKWDARRMWEEAKEEQAESTRQALSIQLLVR